MADAALRALVRDAEKRDDPIDWVRAAHGLVRAGEWDEAGWALVHARARGAGDDALAAIEDALAPTSLEFEKWGVGARLTHGALSHAVWSADGRHVYAVAEWTKVIAFGHRPGQHRLVVTAPSAIQELRPDLAEKNLAIGYGEAGHVSLALFDLETGRPGGSIACDCNLVNEIAAWGEPGVVVCSERDVSARSFRFAADGSPSSSTSIASFSSDMGTLTWQGEIARPRVPEAGGERTMTLIFQENYNDLSFPTARAVHRYSELATATTLGLTAAQVMNLRAISASPSGRHLALLPREEHSFMLVDLLTGSRQTVLLDGPGMAAAWSPSGRRLAVTTALRVNLLEFPV